MITVHIWLPKEGNVGHSSIEVGAPSDSNRFYISWWPAKAVTILKKVQGITQSLSDDVECEGRFPDFQIEINGLDEGRISAWWDEFKRNTPEYGFAGKNCCWVIIESLRAGGSGSLFPWYEVATEKNIPLKNIIFAILVWLAKDSMFIASYYVAPNITSVLIKYLKKILDLTVKNPSVKVAMVKVGDELSTVWSPQDVLAYCSVLKENYIRRQAKEKLWQPAF